MVTRISLMSKMPAQAGLLQQPKGNPMSTPAPVPAHTSTGAALPLAALPQSELLTVNESTIPVIKDAMGPGVHVQPLRLDLEAGCWVVLATFAPVHRSRCITTPA